MVGKPWKIAGLAVLTCSGGVAAALAATAPPSGGEFFRQRVRPILAERCFSCHSEKVQLGGLRLDTRDALLKGGKHGPAVVPGTPEKSLLTEVLSYNGKIKMPPAGRLNEEEMAVLTAWIKQGAPWEAPGAAPKTAAAGAPKAGTLWAFQPIRRPAVPRVKTPGWVRNPVDAFVLAGLERRGLKPSPEADARMLIRRVTLDLTGLPPTPEEVDRFVQECQVEALGRSSVKALGKKTAILAPTPQRLPPERGGPNAPTPQRPATPASSAYERLVDRLLASPHYGERMALLWLDLARYADSDGYHDDTDRSMWAFRDYVIQSFNRNKPFDQFTVEQIAGDLLPNATHEQKVGSAFNRCGPTSSEGGAIPEEVLAAYAVDRVNTTTTVWLGLTMGCAQCHDHKYDPITTRDYYRLFGYFNQVPEEALYRGADAPPTLPTPTPEQARKLEDLGRLISMVELETKPRPDAPDAKAEMTRVAEAKKKLDGLRNERAEVERFSKLRIMQDVPQRRPTFILVRGDYQQRGDEVQPGVPVALGELPTDAPNNRLALARWLVDPRQPLTPRVTVNRFWQLFWGRGLARNSDDFGVRGEVPSHPELLEYLSDEFVRSGWDVKRVLRLMVTSATYRQSSRVTKELQERDPQNRFLARGSRFRLPAELIRDNALAISGLLDRDRPIGGPSVKPYQPGDLWRELSAGDQTAKSYVQDHGADLYRRGLYTVWKRSVLYPSFAVFDAPKREVCAAFRLTTNTPLQAFVTLNDTTYVEAARVFAQHLMEKGGITPDQRLDHAFRRALGRTPTPRERQVLSRVYRQTLAQYRQDPKAALELVSVGESPRPGALDPAELAAWTCVCNAVLNLDECLTRE